MRKNILLVSFISVFTFLQGLIFAQYAPRQDVIWAKMVPAGSITLDGVLNEPAWSVADSVKVVYGIPGPLPTSAWRPEFQEEVYYDKTNATVKFLATTDNKLYLAFNIPDSSVGGNQDWARWDGILMSLMEKAAKSRPSPAVEYFYTWWYVNKPAYVKPGVPPRFIGRYGNFDDTTRTPEQVAAWDAKTTVLGISCDDALADRGWNVEMKIDLGVLGYNVVTTDGDIVALNFSIWDVDWVFAGNPTRVASSRTWIQNPWGNANTFNRIRIFARPGVTTATTTLPIVRPDVVVPNGVNYADPTINGNLNEPVWQGAYTFNIAWDDTVLRKSYPTIGPLASGQFQPELGGNPRPPVIDPSFATVRMFFKGNHLYLSADVNDQLVQGSAEFDKIDGVSFIIADRSKLTGDNTFVFQRLGVNFNHAGLAEASDYLKTMVDTGWATFGVRLKGSTTVNNRTDIDEGFQIEIKVDLTKLGMPGDLGDKLIFMGAMLADADSFDDPLANYGTRTWWFREHDGGPTAAWMVLDPNTLVGVENVANGIIPTSLELYGNYPNPFNPTTKIRYAVPEAGNITITFFNSIGEDIYSSKFSSNNAGLFEYQFDASNLSSGVYFYKISFIGSSTGKANQSRIGKMILMK